jgi:hypothetical protein
MRAYNQAVAYAVGPEATRHLAIIYMALPTVAIEYH